MGSLEGYLEGIPQYVVLTILYIAKGGRLSCTLEDVPVFGTNAGNYAGVQCGENDDTCPISEVPFYQLFGNETTFGPFHVPTHHWFNFTYSVTMLSCTFAILRFLDVGPTRILELTGWRNYVGYGLAFISVLWCLRSKSNGLGSGGYVMRMFHDQLGYDGKKKFVQKNQYIIS